MLTIVNGRKVSLEFDADQPTTAARSGRFQILERTGWVQLPINSPTGEPLEATITIGYRPKK